MNLHENEIADIGRVEVVCMRLQNAHSLHKRFHSVLLKHEIVSPLMLIAYLLSLFGFTAPLFLLVDFASVASNECFLIRKELEKLL